MKSRLQQWLERRGAKNKYGEGFDHVTCRICNRAFKAITFAHLVRKHHFDSARPQQEYKDKYGLILVASVETIRKHHRSQNTRFELLGRRWTKARVKSEIKKFVAKGKALNAESVRRICGSLEFTARKLFGSWSRALAACGIDAREIRLRRLWTKARVIEALKREVRSGRSMSYTGLKTRDIGLLMAAVLRFGTWDSALRAVGVDPSRARKRRAWTKDQVLQEIREIYSRSDCPGGKKRGRRLVGAAEYYYGSWHDATVAAGLHLPAPVRWTRERILNEIRTRFRQGLSIRRRIIKVELSGMLTAAHRMFGSWDRAVQAAGLPKTFSASSQPWSRAELIEFLRRLKREDGSVDRKALSNIRREGFTTPLYAIRQIFGSERKAKREAGIDC